ncbi:hypothetical protein L5515_011268 [Caenorhabditis briggsae]|uniref:Uncharacterized protein n=1 Tax=Caenorhabditis briggsae TaxID=6238 RepID=A0AAE9ESJ1_CAEBR|nr:hypothetical protein L5515_011268 [Caenorhabditis briggsae]
MEMISFLLPLLLCYAVVGEMFDYEQLRRLTPPDYQEQFSIIVGDLNQSEEETIRRVIVLSSHFHEQENFRRILLKNAERLDRMFNEYLEMTKRIKSAKYIGQAILADKTKPAQEQYDEAVELEKQYTLEMSVLLDICYSRGFNSTSDLIQQSIRDPLRIQMLSKELEEYANESYKYGWRIAQDLHQKSYSSRRNHLDARQSFVRRYPYAMEVYDLAMAVLSESRPATLVR